jgi:hypothetical protein
VHVDSCEKIEEVDVDLDSLERTTAAECRPNGQVDSTIYSHVVPRTTSKSGVVLAIDPAGAQNGQMKAGMLWDDFGKSYVKHINWSLGLASTT